MSLRPCIAKLSSNLWAARRHVRSTVALTRRVELRPITTRLLPIDLQESVAPGVLQKLGGLQDELKAAIIKKDVNDLCFNLTASRRVFFTLPRSAWQTVSGSLLRLSRSEIEDIINALVKRCRKGDAEVLGQLLRDAKAMYGVEPGPEQLLSAINAFVRTGQQTNAFDLFQVYRKFKNLSFRPNSSHWQAVMRGLAQIGDVEKLRECINTMKERNSWPFPGIVHYQAFLEGFARTSDPHSVDEVFQILDEIQKSRYPFDEDIHTVLVKLQKKYGADNLPSEYRARCNALAKISGETFQEWLEELVEYRARAKVAFEWKLNSLRHIGLIPDDRMLSRLVQIMSLTSCEELVYLHETLELKPNTVAWSICMRNALEKSGWRSALAAYNVAKSQGVKPDAAMIHPLLRAMCNKYIQEPPEQVLDQALELYKDLDDDAKSHGKPGADTGVFNTLLRALAASKNKKKFFPIALGLLDDMRSQGVYMDKMTATSIAVLLVRSSSSYEEAAKAYKQVRGAVSSGLDEKGFAAVLHAFCSLEPENPPTEPHSSDYQESESNSSASHQFPIPPASLYFGIVHDMQAQGLPKSVEIYTILLRRLADLATRARNVRLPSRRAMIVRLLRKVIKDTHRQISVDAGLQPDAPLLNQLMDTYNRAGLFRDAIHVWTMLKSTGLVSSASISIIFDACGYNRQSDQADTIFRELKKDSFHLNLRNWNAWVECLCRLGRLDEAIQVVCSDMACSESPNERPNRTTIEILLSFALAAGRIEEVRSHIQNRLPDLWNSLSSSIPNHLLR